MKKSKWHEFQKDFEDFKNKFKNFDPKLKKNMLIGSFMIFSVVATGLFLFVIALLRFGDKVINAKIALQ